MLEGSDREEAVDFGRLAEFVAEKLSFMYCTIATTHENQAIDHYITGNTTGEPLSVVQTLKSLALQVSNFDQEAIEGWNEIEHRAWLLRNRNADDSDPLGEEIIKKVLAFTAILSQNDNPMLSREGIIEVYKVADSYFELIDKKVVGIDSQDFVVLPAIAMEQRFGRKEREATARVVEYLDNKTRYLRADEQLTLDAIKMVRTMAESDITSILHLRHLNPNLLTDEDRMMLEILNESGEYREEVEMAMARGAAHPLLNGHLQRPIEWSTDREGRFSLTKFCEYIDRIYRLWGEDIDCKEDLDTLRRALLACTHPGYPLLRKGDSVLSLCWRDYDWQRLVQLAPGLYACFWIAARQVHPKR